MRGCATPRPGQTRSAHDLSPEIARLRRGARRRGRRGRSADDLKIALIRGLTGPLEAYAKQTETGFMMGLEYATKGTMEVDGRKIVVITKDDQSKPDLAKSALDRGLRGRRRRHRRRHDLVAGGDRHAAGRRGAQEDPDRRAGGRRPDHRRQVEPLHLPHRPQLLAGRDLERGGDRQARREHRDARRRTTPSAATASPPSRRRSPRPARPSSPRNTRPPTPPTSPRRPAPVRRAEGQAGQEDHLDRSGRARPIRSTSSPISIPAATASSFRPAATSCRRSPPTSASRASRARPTTTTRSPRTR